VPSLLQVFPSKGEIPRLLKLRSFSGAPYIGL